MVSLRKCEKLDAAEHQIGGTCSGGLIRDPGKSTGPTSVSSEMTGLSTDGFPVCKPEPVTTRAPDRPPIVIAGMHQETPTRTDDSRFWLRFHAAAGFPNAETIVSTTSSTKIRSSPSPITRMTGSFPQNGLTGDHGR